MKTRYLFLFFVLLSCLSASSIALTFDPYALLLFHPQMKDFNQILLRFEKLPPLGESQSLWFSKREKAMREAVNIREDLFRVKKQDVAPNHAKMQEFRQKYRDYSQFEKHWQAYIGEYQKKYAAMEAEITRKTEQFFDSREETEKKILQVWGDCLISLKEFGKTKRISFYSPFFSSHFQKDFPVKEARFDYLPVTETFSPFYHWLQEKDTGLVDSFSDYVQMKDYFSFYPNAVSLMRGRMGNFQILGVSDATEDLIALTLKRKGYDDSVITRIRALYLHWLERRKL